MRDTFLISWLIFGILTYSFGQGEGDNWVFGTRAGINFSDISNPVPFKSEVFNGEPEACVSDSSGRLLFYLRSVWGNQSSLYDSSHELIKGSDSLHLNGSVTNGALILPVPNKPKSFYFFHVDIGNICDINLCLNLYYSMVEIVDDSFVVTSKNSILLNESIAEGIAITRHANGIDWWMVVHDSNDDNLSACTNRFYVFQITQQGISLKQEQNIGNLRCHENSGAGEMKFNDDGTSLATVAYFDGMIELFSFDRCEGLLSNHQVVDSLRFYGPISVSFSNSGQLVYVSSGYELYKGRLLQYDLNTDPISNSRTLIWEDTSDNQTWDMRQIEKGPDGKIYVVINTGVYDRYLSVVNSPDSLGAACDFQPFSFYLGDSSAHFWGLPNMPNYELGPLTIYQADAGPDTAFCMDSTEGIIIGTPAVEGVAYSWRPTTGLDDPNKAQPFASPEQTTTYILTLMDTVPHRSCPSRDDTVVVTVEICNPPTGEDYFPTAFSPNGDGRNELFELVQPNSTLLSLKVFNRWGQLVHDSSEPWDGYFKGKEQPVGTYVYFATVQPFQGEPVKLKGVVSLVK